MSRDELATLSLEIIAKAKELGADLAGISGVEGSETPEKRAQFCRQCEFSCPIGAE